MKSIEEKLNEVISDWNDYTEKRKKWDNWGYLEGLSGYEILARKIRSL